LILICESSCSRATVSSCSAARLLQKAAPIENRSAAASNRSLDTVRGLRRPAIVHRTLRRGLRQPTTARRTPSDAHESVSLLHAERSEAHGSRNAVSNRRIRARGSLRGFDGNDGKRSLNLESSTRMTEGSRSTSAWGESRYMGTDQSGSMGDSPTARVSKSRGLRNGSGRILVGNFAGVRRLQWDDMQELPKGGVAQNPGNSGRYCGDRRRERETDVRLRRIWDNPSSLQQRAAFRASAAGCRLWGTRYTDRLCLVWGGLLK
jgi:hypothetical protein